MAPASPSKMAPLRVSRSPGLRRCSSPTRPSARNAVGSSSSPQSPGADSSASAAPAPQASTWIVPSARLAMRSAAPTSGVRVARHRAARGVVGSAPQRRQRAGEIDRRRGPQEGGQVGGHHRRMRDMHSSYALAAEDFTVERSGAAAPLADLWPGGFRPDDRLGIVLAQPMDACGCSNLICGTNTLFYDGLRETVGAGNFFRYADTFLFGVGCEPGDFNQLDVWPLHKFVSVLSPTAEALIETINDRRITLLALPGTGARTRGEVILSTWNAFCETVRCVITYSPRTGRARGADLALVG